MGVGNAAPLPPPAAARNHAHSAHKPHKTVAKKSVKPRHAHDAHASAKKGARAAKHPAKLRKAPQVHDAAGKHPVHGMPHKPKVAMASRVRRKIAHSAVPTPAKAVAAASATTAAAGNPTPVTVPPSWTATRNDRPEVLDKPVYVYLKTRRIYMRRGPGENYPIDWVYSRRGLPMRVLVKYNFWRKVEDPYGVQGWMHQMTLREGRHFVIRGNPSISSKSDEASERNKGGDPVVAARLGPGEAAPAHGVALRSDPDGRSRVVGYLLPGVVGALAKCPQSSDYCQVRVQGHDGWLPRSRIWGVDKDEAL